MSELLQQLSIAARRLAARQIVHLASEVRCRECLRAAVDESALQHAEHCVVGVALALVLDARNADPRSGDDKGKPLPCEAEIAAMLAGRRTREKRIPYGDDNQKSESESAGAYAEPWRIATAAETDPCRDFAGSLVNAKDELILPLYSPDVDYRHAPALLYRIKECVNLLAGVPTLAIIGTGELTRERMAEVGGVGAAQGELCMDGATA